MTQETKSFTYDALNQMKGYQAKKDGTVVVTQENRYNGNGQRIQKKESKDGKTAVRNYYYQDGSVLYTADGEGKRTGLNLMGTGGNVIAAARGSGSSEAWYLYHKDVRESTSSLINAKGELAAAYQYDAFGNTDIVAGADFDQEICYTGQVYDRNTGLYYYNARFYNPEDGRFITQDTYRGESKEPDTLHLYAYCANNPVNYVDPSGHIFIKRIVLFGYKITKNLHYNRNLYNTGTPKTRNIADKKRWRRLEKKYSACHQFNRKGASCIL